jgi:hypothetical protein
LRGNQCMHSIGRGIAKALHDQDARLAFINQSNS